MTAAILPRRRLLENQEYISETSVRVGLGTVMVP